MTKSSAIAAVPQVVCPRCQATHVRPAGKLQVFDATCSSCRKAIELRKRPPAAEEAAAPRPRRRAVVKKN